MPQSLGLTAYRALVRRNAQSHYQFSITRPHGELLWVHTPEIGNSIAVLDLAIRLCTHRPDLSVLITCHEPTISSPTSQIIVHPIPNEHPNDIKAFLDHWRPNVALWLWGDLRPNLILEAHARNIPLIMANADQDGFVSRRERWLPEVAREVMGCFDNVLARTVPAFERLAKLMRNSTTLEHSGPLMIGGRPLDYVQSDFDELSECLGGRPVWFAAAIKPSEIKTVLAAHRFALRLSHRLLLVLNPAPEEDASDYLEQLDVEGLRSVDWQEGQFPDDNSQVLLATAQDELGLWYRIAPLSFLGSSLSAGQSGLDPFQAASLGTAILYGPNVRNYLPSYTRLAAAGAARIVNDAGALGIAVARLISPDHAATMAMSGWDVVSEGAAITDRIITLVSDALDAAEKGTT